LLTDPGIARIAYSLLLGAGASLAVWQAARSSDPLLARGRWANAALGILLAALIGARLGYTWLNWEYYRLHPLEMLNLRQGGLWAPGAVLLACLTLPLLARLIDHPMDKTADRLSAMLMPLAVAGWLGCWVSGCAVDVFSTAAHFPAALAAALIHLIGSAGLRWFDRPSAGRRLSRGVPGAAAALELALFSLVMLGFSFIRTDPAPLWAGWRPDAWAWLFFCLFAVALWFQRFVSAGVKPAAADRGEQKRLQ